MLHIDQRLLTLEDLLSIFEGSCPFAHELVDITVIAKHVVLSSLVRHLTRPACLPRQSSHHI